MCISDWLSLITGIGTWGLVLFTWRLVYVTKKHLSDQNDIAKQNLSISVELEFEGRFDSQIMESARSKLAQQILTKAPLSEMQNTVMDFFESLGIMVRRGYVDKELAWSSFSLYCTHWWSATKDNIYSERKRFNDDSATIFSEFRKFNCEVQHLGEQEGICYPKWPCQKPMFNSPKLSVSS